MTASNRSVRPRRAAVLRTRVRRSLDATPSLQSEQKLRRKRAEEREREKERKREKERERERKRKKEWKGKEGVETYSFFSPWGRRRLAENIIALHEDVS